MEAEQLKQKVLEMKKARRAVILAHNYQEGPIQDVADFVGDSLKLAQFARTVEEPVILFCGVHFMAESAAMICPDKQVIVPDLAAGCSLADMIVPGQIRAWKRDHPGGVVVGYINTAAAVKAECDYCCTSANGEQILSAIPADKEILFVPDFYLGTYLKRKTGRNLQLWKGYCPAHTVILPEEIEKTQEAHQEAEFIMHPECGCLTKQMDLADKILSTDGMMRYVKESPAESFIVATENGILHRMRKENPEKTFYPASEHASCHHMQRNTLEKVLRSLVTLDHRVTVEPQIARKALVPLRRMLEITEGAENCAAIVPIPFWGDPQLEAANDIR